MLISTQAQVKARAKSQAAAGWLYNIYYLRNVFSCSKIISADLVADEMWATFIGLIVASIILQDLQLPVTWNL